MDRDEQASTYVTYEPAQLLDDVVSEIDFHKTLKLDFLRESTFVINQ